MTYEQEKSELWEWHKKESKRCFAIPWDGGLDGPGSVELKKVSLEANRRLITLKKKYNIPLESGEEERLAKLERMKAEGLF